jgi:hypothetical protein
MPNSNDAIRAMWLKTGPRTRPDAAATPCHSYCSWRQPLCGRWQGMRLATRLLTALRLAGGWQLLGQRPLASCRHPISPPTRIQGAPSSAISQRRLDSRMAVESATLSPPLPGELLLSQTASSSSMFCFLPSSLTSSSRLLLPCACHQSRTTLSFNIYIVPR